MDENKEQSKDLVHLARLALVGRPQDIHMYIVRMARKYHQLRPQLSEQLAAILRDSPTRQSPLRNSSVASVPVDTDSRLQLVRLEDPPSIDIDPIWSAALRAQLDQMVSEHEHQQELRQVGLFPTRTAIFTGPPGVGKTLAARWVASRLGWPLLILDLSAVMSSFLGRTGVNVRHVLDYAKGLNCVLLLDEIDAIAKRRDDTHEIGELKRLVTVLLQEVDDWPDGGLLIAATNHANLLDPAVWRRFDVNVTFPMPSPGAVRQAVKLHIGDESSISDQWLDVAVEAFEGASFSDIERSLNALRRYGVLHRKPLAELLVALVRDRSENLPKSKKKQMAAKLASLGVSQRQISDLTGLSRDTIRKSTSEING